MGSNPSIPTINIRDPTFRVPFSIGRYMIILSKIPKQDDDYDSTKVTLELTRNDYTLSELLEEFTYFLRACGYAIDTSKELEFVEA